MKNTRIFILFAFFGMLINFSILGQHTSGSNTKGKLVINPNPLVLKVGETQKVQVKAIDANGEEVPDGKFNFFALRDTGVVPSSGVLSDTLGNITGMHVGNYNLAVGWYSIKAGLYHTDYLKVTVENWDASTIQIVDIPQKIMEGSIIPLKIKVNDEKDVEILDAKPLVSSSNPQVAQVNAFHQVRAIQPGKVKIEVRLGEISTSANLTVVATKVDNVSLSCDHTEVRTGDVVYFEAKTFDNGGEELDVPLTFSISSNGDYSTGAGAQIRDDGAFVAEQPGFYMVTVFSSGKSTSKSISVISRNVQRAIEVVGQGNVTNKHTTDFWVWEGPDQKDYAVTGTFSADGMAYFWDITSPSNIQLVDSIQVDARIVNDVKISEDGLICVIGREGASSRKNGIIILDVSDPHNVEILSEYTDQLTGGVHNLYIYDKHVYALSNGQRYEIIDISDPRNPTRVGRFEIDNKARAIHDIWIADGIAYSSNWNDGVIMVDVGNGVAGGSPSNPVEISRAKVKGDANHTTFPFRSESAGKFYVLAGDEIFPIEWLSKGLTETLSPRGYVHFIDWSDKDYPKEVASYRVPEAGAHNYWVEDEILYIGYYTGGVRVVDISGELMGDLYKQGREIGYFVPKHPNGKVPNMAMTFGARPYKGHVFFSDMNSGLWAVKVSPQQPKETDPVNIRD